MVCLSIHVSITKMLHGIRVDILNNIFRGHYAALVENLMNAIGSTWSNMCQQNHQHGAITQVEESCVQEGG